MVMEVCKNCRKSGHMADRCPVPIVSYGCIAVSSRWTGNKLENKYVMIRRQHTIPFMDFVRGRYNNMDDVHKMFSRMTVGEIAELGSAAELGAARRIEPVWRKLWSMSADHPLGKNQRAEVALTESKFSQLDVGKLVEEYLPLADETTEWGFPKGRRESEETEEECAVREFMEETGFKQRDFKLLNVPPVVEEYRGTDGRLYQHIYYILRLSQWVREPRNFSSYEVAEVGLFSYDDAIERIKDYHKEKREVLSEVNNQLPRMFA